MDFSSHVPLHALPAGLSLPAMMKTSRSAWWWHPPLFSQARLACVGMERAVRAAMRSRPPVGESEI